MEGYINLSNTLVVPELTERVESETHVCVIYYTNEVGNSVHILPRNIQHHCIELLLVEVHKINGRNLHVFVHNNLLDFAIVTTTAVTVAAVATVANMGLFILPPTSLGLFVAPSLFYSPPLSPSASPSLHFRHHWGLMVPLHCLLCRQHIRIVCLPILIRRGRCHVFGFSSLLPCRRLLPFVSRLPRRSRLLLYNLDHGSAVSCVHACSQNIQRIRGLRQQF